MKDPHVHTYTLKIRRIRAENQQYLGTTGDRAFILNVCKCGNEHAIEYGPVKVMMALYNERINVPTTTLIT